MRRLLTFILSLLLAFTLVIMVPSSAAASAQVSLNKGFSTGSSDPWDSNRLANYQTMAQAGATRVRGDIPWAYLQPDSSVQRFKWSLYDSVIADANRAGLKYLAILHMTPGWANSNRGEYARPNTISLLTDYCYRVAKRYLPQNVTEYEIGNEVNLPHPGLPNTPSGRAYVYDLLAPCSAGIRTASAELNIPATILIGSLAPQYNPSEGTYAPTFLTAAYRAGAANKFTIMNFHPYTTDPDTNPNMNSVLLELNNITIQWTGASRPIWATEYGAPTGGDISITEERQAELVNEAFGKWLSYSFAGPLFWYSDRDLGTLNSPEREDHFGLIRLDGSPKPALAEFEVWNP